MGFGSRTARDVYGALVEFQQSLTGVELELHGHIWTHCVSLSKDAWARLGSLPDVPGAIISIAEHDLEVSATRHESGNRMVRLRFHVMHDDPHSHEFDWLEWERLNGRVDWTGRPL